jgi:multiple sugar transport system substrate-binding protein
MKNVLIIFSLIVSIALCQSGCTQSHDGRDKGPITMNVSFILRYEEAQYAIREITKKFEEENPGIKVALHFGRRDEQYTRILSEARSQGQPDGLDVVSLDSIWITELASKKLVVPIDAYVTPRILEDIHPSIKEVFTAEGKIWAMPFRCYFQLLYYNSSILHQAGFNDPPGTIEEWEEQMEVIKEKKIVTYPLIDSWAEKECLVCEYAWMTGAYGGNLFNNKEWPIFNRGAGLKALETMVRWSDRGLVNPLSLASTEETTENPFLQGNAAFTTDWNTQYRFMIDPKYSRIYKNARVSLIPVSKEIYGKNVVNSSTVSGFQGLGITRHSRHPAQAWKYIQKLTAPENSIYFKGGFPIWLSVQNSERWKSIDPLCEIEKQQLQSLHHRPMLRVYDHTSRILQKYLHSALEQKLPPRQALDKATQEITKSRLPF